MSADEQRIREFAYQIWESEGKPTGQEARHWEMARKLAESETRGERPPAPKPKRVSKPKEVPPVEAVPVASAPPPAAAPRKSRASKAAAEEKPALLKKPRAAKPAASKTPKP